MGNVLEYLIVAMIVAVSAWYAASRYLPKSWRRKLGQQQAAGCGSGCDSCGSCGSAPAASASSAASASASGEGKHRVIMLRSEGV